jgi:hypothetical protein
MVLEELLKFWLRNPRTLKNIRIILSFLYQNILKEGVLVYEKPGVG